MVFSGKSISNLHFGDRINDLFDFEKTFPYLSSLDAKFEDVPIFLSIDVIWDWSLKIFSYSYSYNGDSFLLFNLLFIKLNKSYLRIPSWIIFFSGDKSSLILTMRTLLDSKIGWWTILEFISPFKLNSLIL